MEHAAVDLFAAKGFDGVSTADIASAAGVSRGALYRYYPSKEELAWALFSIAYLRTGEELDHCSAAPASAANIPSPLACEALPCVRANHISRLEAGSDACGAASDGAIR